MVDKAAGEILSVELFTSQSEDSETLAMPYFEFKEEGRPRRKKSKDDSGF
jgi:hypothetical protein